MKVTRTFSYIHATAGPVQHKGVEVLEHELDGTHLHICFNEEKGRQITIDTNSVYTLREELVDDEPTPTLIGDTGRP
jgi:hypothetical protein